MKYFLGVDIGTFESKGVLIDELGQIITKASKSHEMIIPHPGYAEHKADESWWGDFCFISNQILNSTNLDPHDIKSIGCSAIGPCCLPVDSDCNPLTNAILYGVDVRAGKQIEYLNEKLGEEYVLRKYGNPITSQSIGPKILWLKENKPEVYDHAYKFITASTFLVAKLTGNYSIDRYTAAYFTPMYDLVTNDWDYQNLSEFCRPDQLAMPLWTDEIAGYVTEKAAKETGLAIGTPVTVGTADAAADAVGVGVFNPGDMLLMFGSSVYIIHVVPKLIVDKRYWAGPYLFKDTYMVASGMSTAGTLTKWFRDNLTPDLLEQQRLTGIDAYDQLQVDIKDIPAGSEGLIALPYFSGERTPINDPFAKGVFFGMQLNHQRGHLFQAALEGVAYGIAQHTNGYSQIGMNTSRIIAVGGGTKSQKWMQIVSDVIEQPIVIGDVYGAAFGDALIAAYSVGHFKSMDELNKFINFRGIVQPQSKNFSIYRKQLEIYSKLYQQTKDLMKALSSNN